ncbi:PTS hybrid protein [Psychromicrobium silvestre]|uniref:Phosphocarrier protein HPr n=1 Tax=Psychromicrobium silvestre TaxID=1645614 RepID=A0A7Y9S7J7_9MICC|nr:dihydroxyacetone kinase phosphoryl donor subunit DhaM [Psychromicrobium silvestre]NYE96079.1 PTS hybrid protein [Psychromicrobium silvestre]
MTVSLVIVSHSEKLAQGVAELAGQMAPEVRIIAAGGMDPDAAGHSALGTSLAKISAALESANAGDGVLLLADLGSAVMTAESVLEFAGNPADQQLADAALVEGAVAAAVTAAGGASLAAVRAAAETARSAGPAFGTTASPAAQAAAAPSGRLLEEDLVLINPMGLHARPAATLAAALGAMNVEIEINGVDAQSVMMLMTLGAGQGSTLHVAASGADARRAVELVRTEVENGFGEL